MQLPDSELFQKWVLLTCLKCFLLVPRCTLPFLNTNGLAFYSILKWTCLPSQSTALSISPFLFLGKKLLSLSQLSLCPYLYFLLGIYSQFFTLLLTFPLSSHCRSASFPLRWPRIGSVICSLRSEDTVSLTNGRFGAALSQAICWCHFSDNNFLTLRLHILVVLTVSQTFSLYLLRCY